MSELLPPSISRRRKMIQRMKHDAHLSNVLDDFAVQLRMRESLAARGLMPCEYVKALQRRNRGDAYPSERLHILWALINAELWLRQFVDQRGVPDNTSPRLAAARTPMMVPANARPSQPAPIP